MPQFNGYDVKGVFIGDGLVNLEHNSDLQYAVPGVDQTMMDDPVEDDGGGPDGYTRWFNRSEFYEPGILGYTTGIFASKDYNGTATLNPYKYFADGLSANAELWSFLLNTSNDGVFSTGKTNTRNYYIRFPDSKGVLFSYAVVASWDGPETHPANAPESPCVIADIQEDLYWIDDSNWGGDLILDIGIFDYYYPLTVTQPEFSIIVEADFIGGPYALDSDEMIPTDPLAPYWNFHVEIPATDLTQNGLDEFWIMIEYPGNDYENDFGFNNSAGTDVLTAYSRQDVYIADEPYCTDPIVYGMDPDFGYVDSSYSDVTIDGDEFEDGSNLGCYLTDGTTDVIGTNVTWVDSQTVTSDFDFTGAAEGDYDLYFTDGDGCEVVLEGAFNLVEVIWPVTVHSGNNFHISKFIEDSNGVFHIIASYDVNPTSGPWQMHWFHSEDGGVNWTDEGNLWPVSGATGTCSTTGHVFAVDGDGGVYFVTGGTAYASYLCYLDTASLGDPSTWDASDWVSKRVTYYGGRAPVYWALEVTPAGEIFVYARHYSTAYYNRWVYATSWSVLPSVQTGNIFPSYISGLGTLQEQLTSAANGIVFNPDSETFFLGIGGRWNTYTCGAYLLEFTPPSTFSYCSDFHYTFAGTGGLGYYNDIYYGDVCLDADNNVHWVYVTTWPNPATQYYSRQKNEFVMNYGTNQSGSWVTEEPINAPSTTYRFPNVNNYPDPRAYYRPGYLNLVADSDDDLIMTWKRNNTDPDFMGAINDTSGGAFDDPPNQLMASDSGLAIYQGPQGEAYGNAGQVALTFTGKPTPTSPGRGALYFLMTDGETPFD